VEADVSVKKINLAQAHEFPDLTPIPERLHKSFSMELRDEQGIDEDWAVSDTIRQLGVWEPVETAVLSSAFAGNLDSVFVDIGCHIGWYTIIAREWGLSVISIDGLQVNLDVLRRRNDRYIHRFHEWIDKGWSPDIFWPEPCIVKMDIEGAERWAVDAMWDLFDVGSVTHCLMEVSPVFNDSYPALIDRLVGIGYECWVLPEKQADPPPLDDTREWLEDHCLPLHVAHAKQRGEWVAKQHQFNAVFCTKESKWG
jgi:hypothetical protein